MAGDVSAEQLLKAVQALLTNKTERLDLAAKLGSSAKPDAAKDLARLILAQAEGK